MGIENLLKKIKIWAIISALTLPGSCVRYLPASNSRIYSHREGDTEYFFKSDPKNGIENFLGTTKVSWFERNSKWLVPTLILTVGYICYEEGKKEAYNSIESSSASSNYSGGGADPGQGEDMGSGSDSDQDTFNW
jgi:hypothetical protein